jgi:hypothetical protein
MRNYPCYQEIKKAKINTCINYSKTAVTIQNGNGSGGIKGGRSCRGISTSGQPAMVPTTLAPTLGPVGCAYAAASRKAHDRTSRQQLLHESFAADAVKKSAQLPDQCHAATPYKVGAKYQEPNITHAWYPSIGSGSVVAQSKADHMSVVPNSKTPPLYHITTTDLMPKFSATCFRRKMSSGKVVTSWKKSLVLSLKAFPMSH